MNNRHDPKIAVNATLVALVTLVFALLSCAKHTPPPPEGPLHFGVGATSFQNLTRDTPVDLTGYRPTAEDRRKLDNQVLSIQDMTLTTLLKGTHASYFVVDGASAVLQPGDVVCLSGATAGNEPHRIVTKALPSPLTLAGEALGVVILPASPNNPVLVAIGGTLPPSITGLTASANHQVRVSATGRLEQVVSFSTTDFPVGTSDPGGNLTVSTAVSPASGGGGGGGSACSVADLASLRAIVSANRSDTEICGVLNPPSNFVFSAASGGGFADDGITVIQPNDVTLVANGRWYPSSPQAVVPTIAALRAAVAGKQSVLHVQAYSTIGDGGGGDFELDTSDTTTSDNSGTIIVAGTKRWKRQYSGALQANWWGVKADGLQITDGVVTASSNIFSSASAAFTAAVVGRKILLRTARNLATGTLSTVSGSNIATAVGENFPVDLPIIGGGSGTGQPLSGGGIYVGGQFLVAQFSVPSTHQLVLVSPATATVTNQAWYAETQLATTIAGFIDASHVTLGTTATISQSSVLATLATDDTVALDSAIRSAFTLKVNELDLPSGLIGISANNAYVDKSNLRIRGPMSNRATLVDLRKASDEILSPNTDLTYGVLTFVGLDNDASLCTGIHLESFGYDANVPVYGFGHSSGGVSNGSGSRIGFFMRSCPDSSYVDMRSHGFGARDEHLYVDGKSTNFLFDHCVAPLTNNVSLNCNGGFDGAGKAQPEGLRITKSVAEGILVSAASYTIDNCNISDNSLGIIGAAITVDMIGRGIISNNILHDINTASQGVGAIDVFGNNVATSSLVITGNTFNKILGAWHTGHGAAISLNNFGGTVDVEGNTVDESDASGSPGRFAYVAGASTGQVHFGRNIFRGRAGTNLTEGIHIDSTVPNGAVTISPDIVYGESVTTRLSLAKSLAAVREMVTVSATGTTAISAGVETVLVTANGAVTLTLPDPTKTPGLRVTIKNSTTQLGTTTIGTAAGNIDGSATTSISGASQALLLFSDGANWKILTGLSVGGGGVPSTRTLTGTSPIRVDGDNAAHDLSANRTISIDTTGLVATTRSISTTAPLTGGGTLAADRTLAVSNATTSTVGVVQLGTDLGTSATAPTVVQLTGASNSVAIPTTTKLAWASSGPSLEDVSNDFGVRMNTANATFKIFDTSTLAYFFNYNSGNPFIQFGGNGLNIIGTGTQTIALKAASTGQAQLIADTIAFYSSAGVQKGNWTNTGLRVGDSTAPSRVFETSGAITVGGSVNASTGQAMVINSGGNTSPIVFERNGTNMEEIDPDGTHRISNVISGLGSQPSALTMWSSSGALEWWGSNVGGANITWTGAVAATAAAGGGQATPGTVANYLTINVNGTDYKIPLYSP